MPHITVAIPVFNRAHLVGQTIESVLNQSFQDYDLLVVDDASSDNTVEVVKNYVNHDPRIKLIVNEKNLGLTRNWNRCLELAQGPLVQILLSDDVIDSGYLDKVSKVFEQYPTVGIVAASCRYIDAESNVISEGTEIPPKLYKAGDEAVLAFLQGGHPHVSSIVFRRECYERLGFFDEKIWHGPDVEMDTRIAREYDYYHFGSVCSSFRRHGSNMGALEFLRRDFLDVDYLKFKKTWEALSSNSLKKLGINNLDEFAAKYVSQSALSGVVVTIAYGRYELARWYFKKSTEYDKTIWRKARYWKCFIMLIFPHIFRKILVKKMDIKSIDIGIIESVDQSLREIT